ncbi:hypothetical protein [Gilliamella sp. ESL0250]|uniref:hypothetical protein n=1 Tax=Gilliamella sp. ESL0250 TaxID=2705036 RepID=UPI0015810637|nr:hypothetical protein [Gilliamella sp. ESL0250]NUF48980.1 hypothetical protein [Gilliamella sp. ESL0250]
MKENTQNSTTEPSNRATTQPFPMVWDNNKISIYQFLLPYQHAEKLPEIAQTLPDESSDDTKLKWAAGAMDGVSNHHGASSEQTCVEEILTLLITISTQPNKHDIEKLYTLINTEGTLSFIDDLSDAIPKIDLDFDKLYEFTYWLATNSPDREIIKFSIAVLGCFTTEQTDLFLLLGMHEEFTLYSAVALQNTLSSPEQVENALVTLAKKVDGWGRIHIVERLAEYQLSSTTKDWLLRAGYQNSVMNEYLAYTCATTGELNQGLEQDYVDLPLLESAGEILEALIMGGPAEDMHCYEEGAIVCLNYLKHLLKLPSLAKLPPLRTVLTIRDFVSNQLNESYPNWNEKIKNAIIEKANEFIHQDKWLALIEHDLMADDSSKFCLAADLYTQFGFDAWDARFAYQKNHQGEQWYYLMQTDDIQRVQQVIQLAGQQYDFTKLATGPALESAFGIKYKAHRALDAILQELNRFLGMGEDLILIGLNSPVIRNRNMALNAIEAWDRQCWTDKLTLALQELIANEPNDEIKQRLATLLASHNS